MDALKNYIRKQITKRMREQQNKEFVAIPSIIQPILKTIGLYPFAEYVQEVKHAKTVPESEEITLINGEKFFIYLDREDKQIEIGGEKFFFDDEANHYLIRGKINDLLTRPKLKGGEEAPEETPEEEPEEETPSEEPEPAA
jgi:hypothetical protein